MHMEGLNASRDNNLSHMSIDFNGVVAVSEDLGLNNGSKTVLLADSSVSGKGEGSLLDGEVGWSAVTNLDNSSPLGESASFLVVLLASVSKSVESGGGVLVLGAWDDNESLVDLDAWQDAL